MVTTVVLINFFLVSCGNDYTPEDAMSKFENIYNWTCDWDDFECEIERDSGDPDFEEIDETYDFNNNLYTYYAWYSSSVVVRYVEIEIDINTGDIIAKYSDKGSFAFASHSDYTIYTMNLYSNDIECDVRSGEDNCNVLLEIIEHAINRIENLFDDIGYSLKRDVRVK